MAETTRPLPDIPPDMTPQEVPQKLPDIMRKLGNWVAQEIKFLKDKILADPRLTDDRVAKGMRSRALEYSFEKMNRGNPGDVLVILPDGRCVDWANAASLSPSGGSPSGLAHNLLDGSQNQDTVAQGATKGSLVVGNNTPKWDELVVGADGSVLTADSTQTKGVKWAAAAAATHALMDSSVITDVVNNSPTRGSLIRGNSTPKWDELLIGSAGKVLYSDGTDADWSAVLAEELTFNKSQIALGITPSQSTPTPARPAAGYVKTFADGGLGIAWPSIWPEVGKLQRVQGSLGQVGARIIRPGATTVPQTLGMVLGTAVGTVSHPTVANTTYKTSLRRIQVLSAVGANSVATIFEASLGPWPGNAAGLGGFYHCSRGCLTLSTTLGHYGIMGLRNSTSSFGSATAPSNITDAVVLGAEQLAGVGDTTYQIFHNDNVGGAVKTDTGIALDTPVQFEVWIAPNGSTMYCRVTRLDDETVDQFEYNANSSLPRNSLFYAFHIHACTGADTTQAATATLYNAITESPV